MKNLPFKQRRHYYRNNRNWIASIPHQPRLIIMASLNKVILVGNLTRDLEMRDLPSGNKVGNFGLAVNRRYRTQDGDEREETTFVDIAAFGRSAENIARYCHKGSPLLVEGRLRYESWQNEQGEKRNRLSVVLETFQFLPDGKRADGTGPDQSSNHPDVDAPY